jgi:hypothetical protein
MLIGNRALAKILFTPGGARSLVEGMKLPLSSGAAGALRASQILKLAGGDVTALVTAGALESPSARSAQTALVPGPQ